MELDLTLAYLLLHSVFLTIKQIEDKHFSKIFKICIPTLAKRILSEALHFQLSKCNYSHQVFVFHINVKTKLVQTFVTLQIVFTKTE